MVYTSRKNASLLLRHTQGVLPYRCIKRNSAQSSALYQTRRIIYRL